jgi:hypothetical protein
MNREQDVDCILHDCFLAVGQAVGTKKGLDFDAVVWWRTRYRRAFLAAMSVNGNAWTQDRGRVTAVGRFLGERAVHHAGDRQTIDIRSAALASRDVEGGCQMHAASAEVLQAAVRTDGPRRS